MTDVFGVVAVLKGAEARMFAQGSFPHMTSASAQRERRHWKFPPFAETHWKVRAKSEAQKSQNLADIIYGIPEARVTRGGAFARSMDGRMDRDTSLRTISPLLLPPVRRRRRQHKKQRETNQSTEWVKNTKEESGDVY